MKRNWFVLLLSLSLVVLAWGCFDSEDDETDGDTTDGEVDGEPDGEADGEPDGETDGDLPDGEPDGEPDGDTDGDKPDGDTDGDKPDGDTDGDKPDGDTDGDVEDCEPGTAPTLAFSLEAVTTTQAITDMHVFAANDIVAVGEGHMLFRYDGTTWTEEEIDQNAGNLTCVWGPSSDDLYAFGSHAYHWDGSAWSEITGWGVGTDSCANIWGMGTDNFYVATGSRLLHFEGGELVEVDLTTPLGDDNFTGLWGFDNGHIYLCKGGMTGTNFAWFDGTNWAELDAKTGTNCDTIFGLSDDELWFTGHFSDLYTWDGTALTEVDTGLSMKDFAEVRAACSNRVYLLMDRNSASSRGLLQYDGVAWTELADAAALEGIKQFRDMDVLEDGSLLIVGQAEDGSSMVVRGTVVE